MDFVVLSGPCTASGGCTQSPNYPAEYGNSESCEIVAPAKPLYFTDFATEDGYDLLKINGQAYSGSSHPPQGVITSDIVQWTSDSSVSSNGWQICIVSGIVSGLKLARCFLCQFQGRYVKVILWFRVFYNNYWKCVENGAITFLMLDAWRGGMLRRLLLFLDGLNVFKLRWLVSARKNRRNFARVATQTYLFS